MWQNGTGNARRGPLSGLRIVEIAAIGPAPFAAMMLADMGADVVRVDRLAPQDLGLEQELRTDVLRRGRRSIAVDLKNPAGVQTVLALIDGADALIEGFRPGVMERLGLGPEVCRARNPRLVYGRITGWGQEGPLSKVAGHDINFLALTGLLSAVGREGGAPTVPLNLVGDFGGGGMLLALGLLAGLLEAARSGRGDVIDAAMVDGASLLGAFVHGLRADGKWNDRRGTNSIDSGAPWYDCYETADGGWVSLGAVEERFYAGLLAALELDTAGLPAQFDEAGWPKLRAAFAQRFRQHSRDHWVDKLGKADICFSPVLSLGEAPQHPHAREREMFIRVDGVVQPAPAPRFQRHPAVLPTSPASPGQHTDAVLAEWGFSAGEIGKLRAANAIG